MQVDPIDRFGSRQRLLSIDLDIPVEILQNSGPPEGSSQELTRTEVVGHLKLIQYQAAQVYFAIQDWEICLFDLTAGWELFSCTSAFA